MDKKSIIVSEEELAESNTQENSGEEKAIPKKKTTKKKPVSQIPPEYIEVPLDSLGILTDGIKKIHVKDFSFDDALSLDTMRAEDNLKALLDSFNRMIYEDIDAYDLHPSDFITILIYLHGNFYSKVIEKSYVTDEAIEAKLNEQGFPTGLTKKEFHNSLLALVNGEEKVAIEEAYFLEKDKYYLKNIDMIESKALSFILNKISFNRTKGDIPVDCLNTSPIPEFFKREPFKVGDSKGYPVYFRLPRVGDIVKAQEHVSSVMFKEERKFDNLDKQVELLRSQYEDDASVFVAEYLKIPYETRKEYEEYLNKKNILLKQTTQAMTLVAIGKRSCTNIEDKITNQTEYVTKALIEKVNNAFDAVKFGINEEITFFSSILEKEVTRRLSFRFFDFLHTYHTEDKPEDYISFD